MAVVPKNVVANVHASQFPPQFVHLPFRGLWPYGQVEKHDVLDVVVDGKYCPAGHPLGSQVILFVARTNEPAHCKHQRILFASYPQV